MPTMYLYYYKYYYCIPIRYYVSILLKILPLHTYSIPIRYLLDTFWIDNYEIPAAIVICVVYVVYVQLSSD